MIDSLSIILRSLGFIATFQVSGVAIFLGLFLRQLPGDFQRSLRRRTFATAAVGMLLVAAQFALEPARMGGSFEAVLDPSMRSLAWQSPLATGFSWHMAGLLVLLAGLGSGSWTGSVTALGGAAITLFAFTRTGHTTVLGPRGLLAALLLVHLVIIAFWFGALLPLRSLVLSEGRRAAPIVEAFSRLAIRAVPALFIAGLWLAALLLGGWQAVASPYGRLVALKAALFAALMGLAALNKWRYGPALAMGSDPARAFSRTVLAEFALICVALTVTAALTTLYSPEP